jgi:hypothetical protein
VWPAKRTTSCPRKKPIWLDSKHHA